MGLVNHVAAAIPRRKIWRLTQTYSRMSLADLAQQIGYTGKEAEVETMLNEMVRQHNLRMYEANVIRSTMIVRH